MTYHGGIDEIVLLSRALEQKEIQQLMNGWDNAFDVEPKGKLATTWSRLKSNRSGLFSFPKIEVFALRPSAVGASSNSRLFG